jgi:CheY-like chemotaxis protein
MEQRQQQSQRLESLGVLAGGIAHDFNNILTAIIGNLDLAVFSGNLTPHDQESVDAALQAARRAQALVAQTLMFSRQRQVERVPMHLSRVIREVVRLLRASIPSCIEIVHCACSPEPLILGDPAQMHQVLLNLGTNAAQAIGDCEGRIEIWANMEHLDPEAASRVGLAAGLVVRLVVSDSGCGMDEETIQRMFEPFFTTKPLTQGTGIGLSVVHGIVKGHHGVFSVESAVGKGTRISVYFPVHHGELQRSGAGSGRAFTGAGQRVLVVDDEPLATLSRRLLVRLGYSVEAVTDPLFALEILRSTASNGESPFALVITDLTMPKMSAVDLARAVHAEFRQMPVLLATGHTDKIEQDMEARKLFFGILSKPYLVTELSTLVGAAIEARNGLEQANLPA